MASFYSEEELKNVGLKSYGNNVLISCKASIYSAGNISLGDHVRIDDFCILSGNIEIGSYVHIAAYCALYGREGIILKDFSGLSAKVIIYSAVDDFSGKFMISPMVPPELTNVTGGTVILNKFVHIGAGSIILPNTVLGEGVVVGAMSLVTKSLEPWTINIGIPVKFLKVRKKNLLELEKRVYESKEL